MRTWFATFLVPEAVASHAWPDRRTTPLSAYPELGVKFNRTDAIAGVEVRA
jgi:hypothetical protein